MKRLILLLILALAFPAEAGWLAGGYSYRVKITPVTPTADLVDYTLLVPLGALTYGTGIAAKVLNTGYDIAFTEEDGTTLISPQRQAYAEAGADSTGIFYIGPMTLYAAPNQAQNPVYMYYGKGDAGDASTTDAWHSNFIGVWHLEDDTESSAYNHAITGGTHRSHPAGKVANGTDYNYANTDFGSIGVNVLGAHLNGAAGATISAWIKPELFQTTANNENTVMMVYVDNTKSGISLRIDAFTSAGHPHVRIFARSRAADDSQTTVGTTDITTGDWFHVGVVADFTGDNIVTYTNGAAEGSAGATFGSDTYVTGPPTTALDEIAAVGTLLCFDGVIDEVRVSKAARNAAWIAYEYGNMNSASTPAYNLTWGTEEEPSSGGGVTFDPGFDEGFREGGFE